MGSSVQGWLGGWPWNSKVVGFISREGTAILPMREVLHLNCISRNIQLYKWIICEECKLSSSLYYCLLNG
uniref:Uncharacterized protein n=1 Tax=Anguilla anguilla TaxID=7936 RepID=A0A0E9Q5A0_ANGAN